MIKKLIKVGNSLGVILDKNLLKLHNITPESGTEVKISGDGQSICIERVKTISSDKNELYQQAYNDILKEYGPVFKKLSKN